MRHTVYHTLYMHLVRYREGYVENVGPLPACFKLMDITDHVGPSARLNTADPTTECMQL